MSGDYWFEVALGAIALLAMVLSVPFTDGLTKLASYWRIFKTQERRLR